MNNNPAQISYLKNIIARLEEDFSIKPVVGAELEFYLFNASEEKIELIKTQILQQKVADNFEKERAKNQYEITFTENNNALDLIKRIKNAKVFIKKLHPKTSFNSFERGQEVGSSLQYHISFLDGNGKNIYAKKNGEESPELLFSVGGLLALMLQSFLIFAPKENCYKRFSQDNCFTPQTVSWGGDNRTTAIRIPQSTINPQSRNIEHRVAGSDANPVAVLSVILFAIHYGLKNKILPPEKIYGKAHHKQYLLAPYFAHPFPKSLQEAVAFESVFKIF